MNGTTTPARVPIEPRPYSLPERLHHIDSRVLFALDRLRTPAVTRAMRAITRLGDGVTWVWLAIVLLAVGGTGANAGRILAAAALSATVVVQVLKRCLRRPRPSVGCHGLVALIEDPDSFSFFSGHTAAAFAVGIAYAGSIGALAPYFLVFAGLVALSRVYLGAHYPLDVAAGAVIGAASGWLALLVAAA